MIVARCFTVFELLLLFRACSLWGGGGRLLLMSAILLSQYGLRSGSRHTLFLLLLLSFIGGGSAPFCCNGREQCWDIFRAPRQHLPTSLLWSGSDIIMPIPHLHSCS
ncbi:unnamed protein product, partial [Discosporangium mesarthrocarpum]